MTENWIQQLKPGDRVWYAVTGRGRRNCELEIKTVGRKYITTECGIRFCFDGVEVTEYSPGRIYPSEEAHLEEVAIAVERRSLQNLLEGKLKSASLEQLRAIAQSLEVNDG